jgi:hypothetical protein
LVALPSSSPSGRIEMKKIELGIALIRSTATGTPRWLVKQIGNTSKPNLIIGNRLENESFRETVTREVGWELDLDRKRDFLVSNMAQINLEFIDRLPGNAEKSHIIASFYNVEMYRSKVLEQLSENKSVRWIDSVAICDGVTREGQILDPIVPYLINRSSVIQHWESLER